MSEPIDVFFEFASPYSYLAAQRLPEIATRYGRPLRWRPIEIGKIWAAQDVLDAYMAVRRLKGRYVMRDAMRVAADQGVPFTPFRAFPDADLARLTVHHLNRIAPETAEAFVLSTWRKLFVESADISRPDVLVAGLPDACATQIAGARESAEAAADLSMANEAAVASGCFGVPWILVGDEAYFGQDRLDLIERSLAREDSK